MRPLRVLALDEPPQKQRRGDAPAAPRPGVLHVRDLAFHLLPVRLAHGHPPERLPGVASRGVDLARHAVVGGEHAGDLGAQADDDGARERRDVDDLRRARGLLRVHERVREREPPLRVRVVHLDGLPVGRGENVAGAEAAAADHVFARRDDEMRGDVGGRGLRDDARGAEGRARAAHVELHHLDHAAGAGFDVVPAAVERQAFAHDRDVREVLRFLPLGRVRQVNELRRLVRSLGDAQE
mmetsp:Transcript_4880/g.17431  ORF Transcript_4880/g.17431 Transcript_4880/m.17431 type:complete len:239 (+) Transcript_4880:174-890(+)